MIKTEKNKCVIVTGPEHSGSRLVARIISKVLGIQEFDEYSGMGVSYKGRHKVEHISLPSGPKILYPDIKRMIEENQIFDLYFVLATRDINISKLSRMDNYGKRKKDVDIESLKAKSKMSEVLNSKVKYFIWSYETFMFLKKDYLDLLYEFLGVRSDFLPGLKDGNLKYLKRPIAYLGRKVRSLKRKLRIWYGLPI